MTLYNETDHRDFRTFVSAYVEAMLWSSTDNADESGGEPLDANYDESDLAPEAVETIRKDCTAFHDAHAGTWADQLSVAPHGTEGEQAGHDFWLTRNGHGVGFWDGDWQEPAAGIMTRAAKDFGECDAYIGDDGRIHLA